MSSSAGEPLPPALATVPEPVTSGFTIPVWLTPALRVRGFTVLIALAATVAQGWYMPAVVPHEGARPSDLDYFSAKRDEVLAAMASVGRDPAGFSFVAQMPTGRTSDELANALLLARDAVRRGATTIVLGMPPALGAAGVDAVAHEVG